MLDYNLDSIKHHNQTNADEIVEVGMTFVLGICLTIVAAAIAFVVTLGVYIVLIKGYHIITPFAIRSYNKLMDSNLPKLVKLPLSIPLLVLMLPLFTIAGTILCVRAISARMDKNLYYINEAALVDSSIQNEILILELTNKLDDLDIPSYYLCPISYELMRNPVLNSAGYTYDRESIIAWYKNNNTDPISNLRLNPRTQKALWPDKNMEEQIVQYLQTVANNTNSLIAPHSNDNMLTSMQRRITHFADHLRASYSSSNSLLNSGANNVTSFASSNRNRAVMQ